MKILAHEFVQLPMDKNHALVTFESADNGDLFRLLKAAKRKVITMQYVDWRESLPFKFRVRIEPWYGYALKPEYAEAGLLPGIGAGDLPDHWYERVLLDSEYYYTIEAVIPIAVAMRMIGNLVEIKEAQ